MELSDNELVTLLLCSDIALNESGLYPLTDAAYSCFAKALFKSNLEPANLFSMSENSIYDLVNQNKELFSKLKNKDFETRIPALLKRHTQLYIQLSKLQNEGVRVVTRANKELYPSKLRNKFSKSSFALPSVIYYSGNIQNIDNIDFLGVVGSRNIDDDSESVSFTNKLVELAVENNYGISSGGAKGIDYISQVQADKNGGFTVISVPDSLTKKINIKEVRESIMDGRSVYLSLSSPYSRFSGINAMNRNKLIYGCSNYTAVITCSYQTKTVRGKTVIDMNKGGTWVGAHECVKNELSKLLVRSNGEYTSPGNDELIKTVKCIEIKQSDLLCAKDFESLLNSKSEKEIPVYKTPVQTELNFGL